MRAARSRRRMPSHSRQSTVFRQVDLMVMAILYDCGHDDFSVFACGTDFGNLATAVTLVAAPVVARPAHKAFFTKYRR